MRIFRRHIRFAVYDENGRCGQFYSLREALAYASDRATLGHATRVVDLDGE